MEFRNLTGWRSVLAAGAVAAALFTGCGGTTTDITAAVDDTNKNLAPDATIDCPDTVDGGEGTEFDCTLKGSKSGKTKTVKVKVIKDGIAPVSQADYEAAVAEVSK
jgi:hypothetical protein